jgi:recombination protein RecT
MAMIDGLLRRARRSGKIKWIGADVVREGEEFSYFVDERGPHFRHVPGNNFMAPIVSAYAAATTTDDGFVVTVLPRDELEKIRKKSRATREDAPWKEWPEQMMKKTAVRRLSRYLPDGRDWLPDDDDDEPIADLVPPKPGDFPTRPIGAGAALDAFAGSSTDDRPIEEAEAGEQAADALQDSPSHDIPETSEPAAGDQVVTRAPSTADSLFAAYQNGKVAKAAGDPRKVPDQYYGKPDSTKLAHAWLQGWDGRRL